MIQDTQHDLKARIRELEGYLKDAGYKDHCRIEELEQRIAGAKAILEGITEIRPQVFYLDRIQAALEALEGK